jgi:uncharacterized protein (TIGR03083 family)
VRQSSPMEIPDHIGAIEREGALLATAAERAGLDAPVPTCPDWVVRDLVVHQGTVHRWAEAHVSGARSDRIGGEELTEIVGELPADGEILEWFRGGVQELVMTLRAAPGDLEAFTFLPAPSPLAFWARRQAHETAIHRVDAESATGSIGPYDADLAADGLSELLEGFVVRPRVRDGLGGGRTLQIVAEDVDQAWFVRMERPGIKVERVRASADCTVTGAASDLVLLLWNRIGYEALAVDRDSGVLDLWRKTVLITWA